MTVNLMAGNVAAFSFKPLYAAVFSDQQVNGVPSTNGHASNHTAHSRAVDADANDKVIPANKQSLVASVKNHENPVRTMSHVVEVYNQQGKVRIKFMDSKNNAIYQIPSELMAKMEDRMMKSETATNIKG